jgi:hypothetical protein
MEKLLAWVVPVNDSTKQSYPGMPAQRAAMWGTVRIEYGTHAAMWGTIRIELPTSLFTGLRPSLSPPGSDNIPAHPISLPPTSTPPQGMQWAQVYVLDCGWLWMLLPKPGKQL